MSNLYLVTIQLMVVAKSEEDARYAAGDIDLYSCDFEAEKVTDISEVLPEWENAIPYGDQGSDDKTCSDILAQE